MMTVDQNPLVWVDLETTGLDENRDQILEVACVITRGASLEPVAHFEVVTDGAARVEFRSLHTAVQNMHRDNGLWMDSLQSGVPIEQAAFRFEQFLSHNVEKGAAQLAGSTVSFDRRFLRKWMPEVERWLHYRNLDVTALNELARRWMPEKYEARPTTLTPAHRGMADLEGSIAVLRHYLVAFGCLPSEASP